MRLMKGSLVGLVLAGILALAPTAVFAHGGGGGGHGGGFGGGHGGGFGGGHGGGFGGGHIGGLGGGHIGGFGGGRVGGFGGAGGVACATSGRTPPTTVTPATEIKCCRASAPGAARVSIDPAWPVEHRGEASRRHNDGGELPSDLVREAGVAGAALAEN